eukprot:m51a1_g14086 hypothetical protein (301) ;mRNA; f:16159-18205
MSDDRYRERDSRDRDAGRDSRSRDRERDRERETRDSRDRSSRDRESRPRDAERDERSRDRSRSPARDRDRDREREREGREGRSDDSDRSIFVGNLDTYVTTRELERLFSRKGRVTKVDLKTGFAFVFMESGHREAIRAFDGMEFGETRRPIRVEFARGDGMTKKREDERRRMSESEPNETLFVANFDPVRTRESDLERVFEKHGRIIRVSIKKNFAFVQFEKLDDAMAARRALDKSSLDDHELTVEYVARKFEPGRYSSGGGGSASSSRDDYRPAARDRSPDRSPSPRHSPRYSPYRPGL